MRAIQLAADKLGSFQPEDLIHASALLMTWLCSIVKALMNALLVDAFSMSLTCASYVQQKASKH